MNLKLLQRKATHYCQSLKHFENPLFVLLMRLGWINADYCSFRIRKGDAKYNMLGRSRGGDLWLLREVLVEESYRAILKFLPSRPLRIVDIGAHIGAFTIWLHRHHDVNEAFCFEPECESFSLCQFNLGRNGCAKVCLDRRAVGGSTRESEMWIDAVTHARSGLNRRVTSTATQNAKVQVIALSDWLDRVEGRFDLLKMDCEGSEWEILDTVPIAFTRFSIIVAEIHSDSTGQRDIRDFAAMLSQHGFTTISCDGLYIGRNNSDAAQM